MIVFVLTLEIYIYIYIYTCIYIYIQAYIHVYIYIYTCQFCSGSLHEDGIETGGLALKSIYFVNTKHIFQYINLSG